MSTSDELQGQPEQEMPGGLSAQPAMLHMDQKVYQHGMAGDIMSSCLQQLAIMLRRLSSVYPTIIALRCPDAVVGRPARPITQDHGRQPPEVCADSHGIKHSKEKKRACQAQSTSLAGTAGIRFLCLLMAPIELSAISCPPYTPGLHAEGHGIVHSLVLSISPPSQSITCMRHKPTDPPSFERGRDHSHKRSSLARPLHACAWPGTA